ncbi:TonB-dependent receptor [Lacibacter sediminis]|uniref:TonB-dependent receptor n=1 Tax=Lacibacter sediminis TaxID=2760713 RepID=A0A7G5XDQ0_9BACT|nr:TonB-dependent receptor [Lacibacter sediminis]QNA43603.1 TonB-dependent receptor [Lacibacter sediminis]
MRGVIFVGLMLMAAVVNGQTVSVKGEVIDLRSEERVKHATVRNLQTSQSVLSDHRGEFSVTVSNGDTIVISAIGYFSDTVTVSPSTKMISVQLQPATKSLEEVVISGTLREIRKSNSPIAVESYSAKFFKKNASATVFEALSIVNGVQPQLNCNVCNTGDIHINGMEGPYTMVLIDGMPVVSNLATVYGFSGIPANLIKRIEIVKGPSSTLYGSEAVAGLINIITKDPGSAALFHADVYATSYDEVNADVSAKFKLGKAYSLLGVNMFNFGKRYDVNQDNFTDVTLQKRISLFNKWSFDRKNKLPFQFAVRLLTEDRWGGEMQWNKTWRGSDSVYGESIYTKRMELIGNYGIKAGKEQLLLEYSYNFHQQDSYYGKIPYMAKQHSAFAQLRWNKDIGKHSISAGLPYRFIWYDDNTVATAKPDGVTTQPSVQKLQGLFVQDELKFNDRWTMLAGVRYELTNVQGGIVSPRLAVKWNNNNHQVFRFSAGNGFRIVNLFTEDHAALSGAREVVIAESLNPERSWNGNVNYTGTFTPSFGFITLDATLFYTYFTNKIIPDYDTDPQKIIYKNIDGYAVSKGFTLNTDFAFKNRLKIIAGITLMDVFTKEENQDGIVEKQQQLFAPKFSGNYAVSYTFPKWKLAVDLTGKVFGPQRLPVVPNDFRPEYSPWFTLANLQLTQRIGKKVELYGGVKNLLNFMPNDPILRPEDPFDKRVNDVVNNPNGYTFDPSYNYAPLSGRRAFLGVRVNIE